MVYCENCKVKGEGETLGAAWFRLYSILLGRRPTLFWEIISESEGSTPLPKFVCLGEED